jgi:serine/threonine protein phosphatase 1
MKTWAIGDIHGSYKALVHVLERADVQPGDTIITLGDIVDGQQDVFECVELLVSMERDYTMINCKGNHDDWFNDFIETSMHPCKWLQGGLATLQSYCKNLGKTYCTVDRGYITSLLESDIPDTHRAFFRKQVKYYKDDMNNLFIHGGFNRHYLLSEHVDPSVFWWDRDLFRQAMSVSDPMFDMSKSNFKIKEPVNNIFLGHTATTAWREMKEIDGKKELVPIDVPIHAANIYNLDTGAGWSGGKLTIMNVETKEYFQSDTLRTLYPNGSSRD